MILSKVTSSTVMTKIVKTTEQTSIRQPRNQFDNCEPVRSRTTNRSTREESIEIDIFSL